VDRAAQPEKLRRLSSFFCFVVNFRSRRREDAVSRISIAFGAFVTLSAVSASAADFPTRKAGLWEITIAGAHSVKVRQCSNAASDKAMAQAGIGLPSGCAKRDVRQSDGTITIDSVCRSSAGKTTASRIVITGSLESKYTMTVTSQAPGTSTGPTMTLYAERLGPCEPGQKPGDVIMPNGTKINLLQSAETHGPPQH
jgi:hypothetical protein